MRHACVCGSPLREQAFVPFGPALVGIGASALGERSISLAGASCPSWLFVWIFARGNVSLPTSDKH